MQTEQAQPVSITTQVIYASAGSGPLVVIEPPEGMGDAVRNFKEDHRFLTVSNARLAVNPPTLEGQGFELIRHDSPFRSFDRPDKIEDGYFPEAEQLVKNATGASRVLAFDHNIRREGSASDHRKPAGIVHVDLTEGSARRIVKELLPAAEAEKYLAGRIAFINTWRPLTNVVFSAHLALCDASTVPEVSLLKAELRYVDHSGELYYCAFHDQHRWYYYPQMGPQEVLLLKNYDSAMDGRARFSPHTAIDDPTAPKSSPARESIEVRTIAFFE